MAKLKFTYHNRKHGLNAEEIVEVEKGKEYEAYVDFVLNYISEYDNFEMENVPE